MRADLSDINSVHELIEELESVKRIDVFIWCAGKIARGLLEEQCEQEVLSVIDVNFRNALPLIQYVWRRMQDSEHSSRFVTIASSSGIKARKSEAVYVASKFAQVGLTRSLSLEARSEQQKVLLVLPGGMQTPFWNNFPNSQISEFLDPDLVANKILRTLEDQSEPFLELEIPRGSL